MNSAISPDNWQRRLCVFWYIVLVDLLLNMFTSCVPSLLMTLDVIISRFLASGASLSQAGIESLTISVGLWLTIMIRGFEFTVLLYWLEQPAAELALEFGFSRKHLPQGLVVGLAVVLVLGGGFFLSQLILSKVAGVNLVGLLGLGPGHSAGSGLTYQLSYIAAAGIVGPFFEEIIFVGLVFGAFRKRFSLATAFLLALGHFVAAHIIINILLAHGAWDLKQVLSQALIWLLGGTLFLALYARFRSLIPSMIVHGAGNILIFWAGRWFS